MKHEFFLKSKLNLNTSLRLHFQFQDLENILLLVSFADFHSTEFMFAFASSYNTKNFHCFVLQ